MAAARLPEAYSLLLQVRMSLLSIIDLGLMHWLELMRISMRLPSHQAPNLTLPSSLPPAAGGWTRPLAASSLPPALSRHPCGAERPAAGIPA